MADVLGRVVANSSGNRPAYIGSSRHHSIYSGGGRVASGMPGFQNVDFTWALDYVVPDGSNVSKAGLVALASKAQQSLNAELQARTGTNKYNIKLSVGASYGGTPTMVHIDTDMRPVERAYHLGAASAQGTLLGSFYQTIHNQGYISDQQFNQAIAQANMKAVPFSSRSTGQVASNTTAPASTNPNQPNPTQPAPTSPTPANPAPQLGGTGGGDGGAGGGNDLGGGGGAGGSGPLPVVVGGVAMAGGLAVPAIKSTIGVKAVVGAGIGIGLGAWWLMSPGDDGINRDRLVPIVENVPVTPGNAPPGTQPQPQPTPSPSPAPPPSTRGPGTSNPSNPSTSRPPSQSSPSGSSPSSSQPQQSTPATSAPYGMGSNGVPCQQPPTQPSASYCTSGGWIPTYTNNCLSGWQCVPSTSPSAQTPIAGMSCNPTLARLGAPIVISYTCVNAVSSTGNGFSTGGALSGTTTVTLAASSASSTQTSYALSCTSASGVTSGGMCVVTIAKPYIVFAAVPELVQGGDTASLGWITRDMNSCTVSSPLDANFTAQNASITNTNGTVATPPITLPTEYVLQCTAFDGTIYSATTTISVGYETAD